MVKWETESTGNSDGRPDAQADDAEQDGGDKEGDGGAKELEPRHEEELVAMGRDFANYESKSSHEEERNPVRRGAQNNYGPQKLPHSQITFAPGWEFATGGLLQGGAAGGKKETAVSNH